MSYVAGSRLRSTVVFTPEAGSTALITVSATLTDGSGNVSSLTPSAGAANTYSADFTVPDTAPTGPWVVRWESSAPKISVETTFTVVSSGAVNP